MSDQNGPGVSVQKVAQMLGERDILIYQLHEEIAQLKARVEELLGLKERKPGDTPPP